MGDTESGLAHYGVNYGAELSELNLSEASVHEVVMTSNLLTPTFIFVSVKTIF